MFRMTIILLHQGVGVVRDMKKILEDVVAIPGSDNALLVPDGRVDSAL